MKITAPFIDDVVVMADSSANLNVINGKTKEKCQQYICSDRKGFRVTLASGYVTCQQCMPIKIKCKRANYDPINTKPTFETEDVDIWTKFYILHNCSHNWILARRLLEDMRIVMDHCHKMYEKIKTEDDEHELGDKFEHPYAPGLFSLRNEIDETMILDDIKVKRQHLKGFITNLLQKHLDYISEFAEEQTWHIDKDDQKQIIHYKYVYDIDENI